MRLSRKGPTFYIDPDNYTDPPTFLSALQRNPRLRPYDFWPLVADSTVIVQHISSVVIFVCSFVGIYQQRVSPVSVLSWGSAGTVLGWILWDFWIGQAAILKIIPEPSHNHGEDFVNGSTVSGASSPITSTAPTPSLHSAGSSAIGLGLSLTTSNLQPRKGHAYSFSQTSISSGPSPTLSHHPSNPHFHGPPTTPNATPFAHSRLATAKSAILIYIALLGLSPILKSLTESTTSDSIWAMTTSLMGINIFFFDYSGGVGVKFPASLSTNAALMASTVLASRLPSTTHVFSLTLFSIEVFGLFPVFRRHLRHISWRGHLLLTSALVVGAGASLGTALSKRALWQGGWKRAMTGAVIWGMGSALGMGGCSWWLIGLQRYKNVVIGPWDPARPVIKGGQWDQG
jgi:phosphatidylinositol glycan class C protein